MVIWYGALLQWCWVDMMLGWKNILGWWVEVLEKYVMLICWDDGKI